jgi:hypothetical protein
MQVYHLRRKDKAANVRLSLIDRSLSAIIEKRHKESNDDTR